MTRQEAVERLVECQRNGDTEGAHSEADRVLCERLRALGEVEVVAAWEAIHLKWYA